MDRPEECYKPVNVLSYGLQNEAGAQGGSDTTSPEQDLRKLKRLSSDLNKTVQTLLQYRRNQHETSSAPSYQSKILKAHNMPVLTEKNVNTFNIIRPEENSEASSLAEKAGKAYRAASPEKKPKPDELKVKTSDLYLDGRKFNDEKPLPVKPEEIALPKEDSGHGRETTAAKTTDDTGSDDGDGDDTVVVTRKDETKSDAVGDKIGQASCSCGGIKTGGGEGGPQEGVEQKLEEALKDEAVVDGGKADDGKDIDVDKKEK